MKIYVDRLPNGEYPKFKWKDGDRLFLVLDGINIHANKYLVEVEPVYIPVVRVERSEGMLAIHVRTDDQNFAALAFTRWAPYIQIIKTDTVLLEEDL